MLRFTKKINKLNNIARCTFCTKTNLNVESIFKNNTCINNVKLKGWVKSLRKMKDNTFFDINDGSCSKPLQVFISTDVKPSDLSVGSSVVVNGNLKLSPKGQLELEGKHVEVIGKCVLNEGYPFAPKKSYSPDYIRQYLHLRGRTKKFASLLRVRNAAVFSIHEYLFKNGFINIHTPVLTSNDCEDAGEVFVVTPQNKQLLKSMERPDLAEEEVYFNSKVFLTVSGQLHLEAMAHGLSKVYSFGPIFRAENSRSRLHLSEFFMLEAEVSFIEDINELMNLIEKFIKNVTQLTLDKSEEDMHNSRENNIELNWLNKPFPVLSYNEAVKILKSRNEDFNESNGFTKEDEVLLVSHCGDVPTFIINWPKKQKPFYMKECVEDNSKVYALDLLGPKVGEILGGSLRESDYNKLKDVIPTSGLDWYLDLRKFGGVPTAGFGLGFERYLQVILGINNIKDCLPFPRWPHNCFM